MLRDRLRALDRLQKGRVFKITATALIALVAIGFIGLELLGTARDSEGGLLPPPAPEQSPEQQSQAQEGPDGQPTIGSQDATARAAIERILSSRDDATGITVGVLIVAGLALLVVWLGLGLTYVGLAAVGAAVVWPLSLLDSTEGLARLIGAVLVLTGSFVALIEGARLLLGAGGPIPAIARNVLAEAVRLKMSLVFIVGLVLGLALLPGALDDQEELRYRVQTLLSFGTGGTFWVLALLTVLFSVATVAFEQRSRVIWQTATKPVSAWQYVAGKWLGVVTLNAVLLAVCASGVFLFTEHLRDQTAVGEIRPYDAGTAMISEDRLKLESEVLTARISVDPAPPIQGEREMEDFNDAVQRYIQDQRRINPDFVQNETELKEVADSLLKSVEQQARAVPLGGSQRFAFQGMAAARESTRPITLSYKVNAGGNMPNEFYDVVFFYRTDRGWVQEVRTSGLNTTYTMTLPNDAIQLVTVDKDGQFVDPAEVAPEDVDRREWMLLLEIVNAGQRNGAFSETLVFPAEGLQVSYSVGGYRTNFFRVSFVLWLKLAAIAMVGVTCGTFLSFPVGVLVTIAIFLAAEGTSYMSTALDSYRLADNRGNDIIYRQIAFHIATGITQIFRVYSELKPTEKLVEGRLMSFRDMATGLAVVGGLTAILYLIAVQIFRRRELATYSGQ